MSQLRPSRVPPLSLIRTDMLALMSVPRCVFIRSTSFYSNSVQIERIATEANTIWLTCLVFNS